MRESVLDDVRHRVSGALGSVPKIVLAVSGGADSMAMLDAAAAVVPRERLVVASFDHGTGAAARDGVALARRAAAARQLDFHAQRATVMANDEASWREARWSFLRRVAAAYGAVVATAHTRDDAIETALMRVLRDAGARGLAGLFARSDVLRPVLGCTRAELRRYAGRAALEWIDDPSNDSSAHLRNRVRHDVLPALSAADPAIAGALERISRDAAAWRSELEAWIDANLTVESHARGALDVPVSALLALGDESLLATVWPAVAARAGAVLDHRGTRRLAAFTMSAGAGAHIQLSGGWTVHRSRDRFELRHASAVARAAAEPAVLRESRHWGVWSFVVEQRTTNELRNDRWSAAFGADEAPLVRTWRAGDRMRSAGRAAKVKHLLAKAGISGHLRERWPVVEIDGEIVWIPGVRRAPAAPDRSGRPVRTYRCALEHR